MLGNEKNKRLNIEQLPDIETEVGVSRSTRQQEVGGPVCLGVVAGVAIYSNS